MNSLKVTVEEYTLRVCIFKVGRGLLEGRCIVYLNLENLRIEYTLRVCVFFVRKILFICPLIALIALASAIDKKRSVSESIQIHSSFFILNTKMINMHEQTIRGVQMVCLLPYIRLEWHRHPKEYNVLLLLFLV